MKAKQIIEDDEEISAKDFRKDSNVIDSNYDFSEVDAVAYALFKKVVQQLRNRYAAMRGLEPIFCIISLTDDGKPVVGSIEYREGLLARNVDIYLEQERTIVGVFHVYPEGTNAEMYPSQTAFKLREKIGHPIAWYAVYPDEVDGQPQFDEVYLW